MAEDAMAGDAVLIRDHATLKAAMDAMAASPFLAMDTEFVRETSYFPRLCLIQIASPDAIWLIDPIALPELDAFWAFLLERDGPLVLHSAEQDLELIHLACGRLPQNLFDTQLAAALLGMGEQIGYAPLVRELCGVELDKSHGRTDWARRPLDRAQLDYAADDVRYLREIYPKLIDELARRGRRDWLNEDFARLSDPARFEIEDERQWRRVKGHQRLKGRQLAILLALAAWREQQAREADCPRRWVLPDDLLVDMARVQPDRMGQLERLRGWPKGTLSRHGPTLLKVIEQGGQLPRTQWPRLEVAQRPDAREEALLAMLQAAVKLQAWEHNIAVNSLGSGGELLALLRGERALPLLEGWRRHVVGDVLLALLEGRAALGVQDGKPCLLTAA